MPDRCVVHGCSNRLDMNTGISAHFSPTIKSERDKWLRFVHTHRENFNPSGKFVAGCWSISQRNVFQEPFHMEGCRHQLIPGLILAIWKIDPWRKTIFQTTTTQGKSRLILCTLSLASVLCQPWSFLFRRSILYVYSQTSLRFANIFSSNSSSLVLFMSPRCCILVFYPFCLFQSCGTLVRSGFAEEHFNGFQNFQINRK